MHKKADAAVTRDIICSYNNKSIADADTAACYGFELYVLIQRLYVLLHRSSCACCYTGLRVCVATQVSKGNFSPKGSLTVTCTVCVERTMSRTNKTAACVTAPRNVLYFSL
jgi:hypothetical protein